MSAWYNENDPFAAAWLRELIGRGLIAEGVVDERSIAEVKPEDLEGFTQCHFFAGVGVWSLALRAAGWPDDFPVWTGSCPCPAFSASGKRRGFSDPRHLWPTWGRLIGERRPLVIFGEQVAKKDGLAWFDVVSSELEAGNYTIGATCLPACGFGAPHIRERLYFVAHSHGRDAIAERIQRGWQYRQREEDGLAGGMVDAERRRCEQRDAGERRLQISDAGSAADLVGNPESGECGNQAQQRRIGYVDGAEPLGDVGIADEQGLEGHAWNGDERNESGRQRSPSSGPVTAAGPTNGYWRDAAWIGCSDGATRPVPPQPAFFPLVDGPTSGRVGLLRGAGNAIVAPVAEGFIRAFVEEMICR